MTYARIATQTAWLGKEFGETLARRMFGDAVVDALPRVTRGKNVGKIKAEIEWQKVESGGWVRREAGGDAGHVERRVGRIISARIISRDFRTREVTQVHATIAAS